MQIAYKSLFTKGVQNVHHLHGHIIAGVFSTGQLSVDNVLSEIGPKCSLLAQTLHILCSTVSK